MHKITPCLSFDGQAEEAARFYCGVFPNSAIGEFMHYAKDGPGPEGAVLTVTFRLEDQDFMALNGGPQFRFTPAISLFVSCETQSEIDRLWDRLSEGGETNVCGWLTDRYGVSWQIVPKRLGAMLRDGDREKASRAMAALMKMTKLDLAALERAYDEA